MTSLLLKEDNSHTVHKRGNSQYSMLFSGNYSGNLFTNNGSLSIFNQTLTPSSQTQLYYKK